MSNSNRIAAGSFRGDISELVERLGSKNEVAARARRKAKVHPRVAGKCPRTLNQSLFEKAWRRSED